MHVQSIQGDAPVIPETEEYGISSFVYRARRPFHPQRLFAFMRQFYTLQEEEMQDDNSEEGTQEDSDEEGELSVHLISVRLEAGQALYSDKGCRATGAFMMQLLTKTRRWA